MNLLTKSIISFFVSLIFFVFVGLVSAHSGRTDSSGCHNCNVGSCAGTYHCHNGGSVGGGYVPVTPTIVNMPDTKASVVTTPNDHKSFSVKIDWDRPNGGNWSIGLSKVAGANPGPLSDTRDSNYTFLDVKTGTYYINLKELMPNGYWSNIAYWTVKVPAWSTPTPTPIPSVYSPQPVSTSNAEDGSVFVGLLFIFLGGLAGLYFAYKVLAWVLTYAKENEWIYTLIFYGVLFAGMYIWSLFSSNNSTSSPDKSKTKTSYSCNCSKTCPNLTCAEAQYQLNECGCKQRDADHDGTACDAQCQ